MNLEPGLRITETLILRSQVGEGGMGQVWSAHHAPLDRIVAVKVLSATLATDEVAIQRFTLEAQTLARMNSPHIPRVFDLGTIEDGRPYMVMELVEGQNLQARLGKRGALSPAQTVKLVAHVGDALATAHALGVVHRDVKPENIVLVAGPQGGDDFTAQLVDFGIAKPCCRANAGGLTRSGTTLGTPSYMSPEQLMTATAVGPSADLWSLAVVAYACLTGALPFAGETFGAVCLSIHNGVFTTPSALRPDLPVPIDRWFQSALNRDPAKRFESAAAMAEALREAVEAVPAPESERATSPGGRPDTLSDVYLLTKRKRREPAAQGRAALPLVAVALAVAALLTWGSTSTHVSAWAGTSASKTATAHELVADHSRP